VRCQFCLRCEWEIGGDLVLLIRRHGFDGVGDVELVGEVVLGLDGLGEAGVGVGHLGLGGRHCCVDDFMFAL